METITFDNIQITGIDYVSLLALTMEQRVNQHATALVTVDMSEDSATTYLQRAKENTILKIMTTAKGQHSTLFCGVMTNIKVNAAGGYAQVIIELKSTSILLDLQPKNQTFQQTQASYGEVMKKALGANGTVTVNATDAKTGNIIIRYGETDWQFIKRMASQLKAVVYPEVFSETPSIQIGMAQGRRISLEKMEPLKRNTDAYAYGSLRVGAVEYAYLGEKIIHNGTTSEATSIVSIMDRGRLISLYEVDNPQQLEVEPAFNAKSSGKMFLGEVIEVKQDKVKVNFLELDGEYDAGGDQWFPYSTAYSSSDGSGLYLMPEVGDKVRVFMPSENEKDAFAASSVNCNPQLNTRAKSWKAPGGKEILLTDDGIYIICEKEKIYISLSDQNGIQICSSKKIEITSEEGIIIQSDNRLELHAESSILMEVGNSKLEMNQEKITMTANNVYVN